MKKLGKVAGIALIVAVVGLLAVSVASAQEPNPPVPGQGIYWEDIHESVIAAAADALGMTVDEVEAAIADGTTMWELADAQGVDISDVWAAMDAARAEELDKLAEAGVLTEAQANLMLGAMQHRRARGLQLGVQAALSPYHDAIHEATADALGMTVEEFDAAIASGQTLVEIAAEQGVDLETVLDARDAAVEAQLDQLVADGYLTEAQAERISERAGQGIGRLGGWFGSARGMFQQGVEGMFGSGMGRGARGGR
jgi:hypothetical protein